jgi:hypothetical protein
MLMILILRRGPERCDLDLVFSVALKQGARIFARPAWQAATQAITSLLMLFFAAKLLLTLS